jgi:hypothetical protein
MKEKISTLTVLFAIVAASICFAAPILTKPAVTNIGANIATLNLQSNGTGRGYFTLRTGTDANCNTGASVAFGPYSSGSYHGSLSLTANVSGKYTVRNLLQNAPYTVCFTADDATVPNLNQTPVFTNISTTSAKAFAFPGWRSVGSAGFSSTPAHFTSLAFAPDGTPYMAYVDANDTYKISVMKFSDINGWLLAGSSGFATGTANPASLVFAPDGTPHLSFVDATYTTQVMQYDGINTWTTMGTGLAADTDVTSLAFAPDGTPYVAYIDGSDSRATVMKYSAGAWSSSGVSLYTASSTSLAIAPNGTPYVAYSDYGNSGKATVMQYHNPDWTVVGSTGFSAGTAITSSLAIAPDGTLYLAFQDGNSGNKATVMKFTDSTWSLVGDAGFSAGTATNISLAIAPDGKPSVAFQDGANRSKSTVLKYTGSTWSIVGNAAFSAGTATSTHLAFAPDGSPYVAYGDEGNGSRATLMQLVDTVPTISGAPPTTATVGLDYNFTPTATYAEAFSIVNKPSWALFNTSNGILSGLPQQGDIGAYPGIVITATNSVGSTSLPTFSIEVTAPSATGSVRIGSTTYPNISTALATANNGDTLQILATITLEGLNYSGSGSITLEGGYDADWTRNPVLFSPLSSINITSGTLIFDRIEVQ